MPLHRLHPLRVHHAGAENAAGFVCQIAHARPARVARVAEVGGGIASGKGPHRCHHAAVILQVVVAVENIVLTVVLILHRNGHRRKARFKGLRGFQAIRLTGIGIPTPGHVDLGQILVTPPVALVEQGQNTGAVRARLGAEDPVQAARTGFRVGNTPAW